MSEHSENSINIFILTFNKLLNYSLVEFILNIIPTSDISTMNIKIISKEKVSEVILSLLKSRNKSVIILDFDSLFFPEKLQIIEKLSAASRNFKTIALCNAPEFINFSNLYTSLFDDVLRKNSPLVLFREKILNKINELLNFNTCETEYLPLAHYQFLMLTPKEHVILKKIMSGKNNNDIARDLFISHKTVCTHRSNIYAKFSVKTLAGLYNYLKKESLINTTYFNTSIR